VDIVVPYSSMVFIRAGTGFHAIVSVDLVLTEVGAEKLETEIAWVETLFVPTYELTQRNDAVHIGKEIPAGPGEFTLDVVLTDMHSGKSTVRSKVLSVHEAGQGLATPGEIRIILMEDGAPRPFLGVHLPQPSDSIRCVFNVYGLFPGDTVDLRLDLQHLVSDSSLPAAPYGFSAFRGSLDYRGIDLSSAQTMFTRGLLGVSPGNEVEFRIPALLPSKGVFRVRVSGVIAGPDGRQVELEEVARYLVVMPPGFPKQTRLDDLVASLVYIAREDELDSLMAARDDEEKRARFEKFWLSIGGTEERASAVIRQYYTRVEEANLYFSSFTEGWRTDRGMVYIVFGPPLSVATGPAAEVWRYSNDDQDAASMFVFQRIPSEEESLPFDHYLLDRRAYYDQPWLAAVERWRRGAGF
jgi:GWxTD domain-containing protein